MTPTARLVTTITAVIVAAGLLALTAWLEVLTNRCHETNQHAQATSDMADRLLSRLDEILERDWQSRRADTTPIAIPQPTRGPATVPTGAAIDQWAAGQYGKHRARGNV